MDTAVIVADESIAKTISEAKKLFNETWDLIDQKDRTPADDALMLHKAHTSCYLWRSAEKPVNHARGEWQVSHVYALLGFGAPALLHGRRSLDICLEHSIGGLDLAFGYEAVARAYMVLGDAAQAREFKRQGLAACEAIAEQDDRNYAAGEINGIG